MVVVVARVARAMGLARFGALSAGGTKVRANASKRKAMSYERIQKEEARLEREVGELLAAARSAEAEEDALHGEGVRGDEVPEACAAGMGGWRRSVRPGCAWTRRPASRPGKGGGWMWPRKPRAGRKRWPARPPASHPARGEG